MQITHLGHACLLVEEAGQRILIDPGTFSAGFEDLEDIDAVVVTHQHADHIDVQRLPAVLAANPRARVIAEPQARDALRESLRAEVTVEPMSDQPVDVGGVRLTPVGRLHAEIHPYIPRIGNVGVVLQAGDGPRLYHPGDSYDGEPADVDVLAVPLSAPWAAVRDTIAFVRRIAPRVAVPIHDGTASAPGRAMYLSHVSTYGGDDLVVQDLADRRPWTVAAG